MIDEDGNDFQVGGKQYKQTGRESDIAWIKISYKCSGIKALVISLTWLGGGKNFEIEPSWKGLDLKGYDSEQNVRHIFTISLFCHE